MAHLDRIAVIAAWRLNGSRCVMMSPVWSLFTLVVLGAQPVGAQDAALPDGLGHSVGNAGAPVRVIEFSDFGCGYCARFALETFPELEREFVTTGRVLWTYVPFRVVAFPNSDVAAEAAECAGEQDGFWPMHRNLFAGRRAWSGARDPAAILLGYAQETGLNERRFTRCVESGEMRGRLHHNTSIARAMGARATPTFFVNGRRVEGALPLERFRAVLLRELEMIQSQEESSESDRSSASDAGLARQPRHTEPGG